MKQLYMKDHPSSTTQVFRVHATYAGWTTPVFTITRRELAAPSREAVKRALLDRVRHHRQRIEARRRKVRSWQQRGPVPRTGRGRGAVVHMGWGAVVEGVIAWEGRQAGSFGSVWSREAVQALADPAKGIRVEEREGRLVAVLRRSLAEVV